MGIVSLYIVLHFWLGSVGGKTEEILINHTNTEHTCSFVPHSAFNSAFKIINHLEHMKAKIYKFFLAHLLLNILIKLYLF